MEQKNTQQPCKDCNGKGYYTQMFGKTVAPDFFGDDRYEEKSTVHKIACPKCNWRNKQEIVGVQAHAYASPKQ